MALSFAELKNNAKSFESLNKEVSKLNDKQEYASDDRFWQPTVDKAKNGFAIIRFLPAVAGEDVPFVRLWDHGFKGPSGKWYIENSRSSIGEDDPVMEYNSKLWNASSDDNSPERKQARDQKRRLFFVSNIYVIKDSGNPENDGKVFLYRYGKKIFDKINDLMNPTFEGETPVNPFDFWTGATFKMKIRDVEGYRNYDKSSFDEPSPLFEDDEKIEAVWKKEYPLQPFLAPDNFKSYDELKKKLDFVLNNDLGSIRKRVAEEEEREDTTPAPKAKAVETESDEDEDSHAEYIRKLMAAED